MAQGYVVGFLFDSSFKEVLLIRKNKPDWQRGRWNGVGGKIENNEPASDAMAREFHEETGVMTLPERWRSFGRLHGGDRGGWTVHLFFAVGDHELLTARTTTEEEVGTWGVQGLLTGQTPIPLLGNIRWLLQMAMAVAKREDICRYFDIGEV